MFQAVVAATSKAALPQKTINVMTYNILAQKYAQSGWHNYCPSRYLRWEYRRKLLLEELEGFDSDIICLQEVEAEVFSRELQPWLAKRGYQGHYLARQYGENVQGPPEGVALFYRSDIFELVLHRAFTFSSVPTDPPAPRSPAMTSSDSEDTAAAATAATAGAAAVCVSNPGVETTTDVEAGAALEEVAEDGVVQTALARSGSDTAVTSACSSSSSSFAAPQPARAATAARGAAAVAERECATGQGGVGSSSSDLRGASSRASASNGSSSDSNGTGNGNGNGSGAGRKSRSVKGSSAAAAADVALTSLDEDTLPTRAAAAPQGDQSDASTSGRSSGNSNSSNNSSRSSSRSSSSSSSRGNNEFWSVFTRRQEGAILALLRHRPTQKPLLAAVTHLFWNPAFPNVKAFQAAVLCAEMAAFLRQHAGGEGAVAEVPVVLAGDFNSLSRKRVPDVFDPKIPRGSEGLVSGVYTLLTRGSLPPDHPDHPAARRRPGETSNPDFRGRELTTSGINLTSAYRQANGRDPPLTTRTATFAGCLDYIFVSPQHFDVTSTLDLPYDLPYDSYNYDAVRDPLSDVAFSPIPNASYPSDHVSLVAQLRIKDQG